LKTIVPGGTEARSGAHPAFVSTILTSLDPVGAEAAGAEAAAAEAAGPPALGAVDDAGVVEQPKARRSGAAAIRAR
jgi:hypothetical protein